MEKQRTLEIFGTVLLQVIGPAVRLNDRGHSMRMCRSWLHSERAFAARLTMVEDWRSRGIWWLAGRAGLP